MEHTSLNNANDDSSSESDAHPQAAAAYGSAVSSVEVSAASPESFSCTELSAKDLGNQVRFELVKRRGVQAIETFERSTS